MPVTSEAKISVLCELHCHSTYSDGTLSPREILRSASEGGLGGLALTDHDTLAGLDEALETATQLGIEFLSGVEVSSNLDGEEVHLLGYGFDPANAELCAGLAKQAKARLRRIPEILERLHTLGIELSPEEVAAQAGSAAVGRPHIARALMEKGICSGVGQAFQNYLHDHGPAFVPKQTLPAQEVIQLVHQARGIVVLAHPAAKPIHHFGGLEYLLAELVRAGLDGLEVQHPAQSSQKRKRVRKLGRKLGLLETGGSDFHGANSPGIEIGRGRGDIRVPLSTFHAIQERTEH